MRLLVLVQVHVVVHVVALLVLLGTLALEGLLGAVLVGGRAGALGGAPKAGNVLLVPGGGSGGGINGCVRLDEPVVVRRAVGGDGHGGVALAGYGGAGAWRHIGVA